MGETIDNNETRENLLWKSILLQNFAESIGVSLDELNTEYEDMIKNFELQVDFIIFQVKYFIQLSSVITTIYHDIINGLKIIQLLYDIKLKLILLVLTKTLRIKYIFNSYFVLRSLTFKHGYIKNMIAKIENNNNK